MQRGPICVARILKGKAEGFTLPISPRTMIDSILGCAVSGSEVVGIFDNFDPAFSLCADFFLNSRT